jgi:ELWxxDGT repeat protein
VIIPIVILASIRLPPSHASQEAAGLAYLVKDINTLIPPVETPDDSDNIPSSDPHGFIGLDSDVYFSASDDTLLVGPNGRELWRTDGTSAGTWFVRDVFPGPNGSNPYNLGTLNGQLFFFAESLDGRGLWKSNGTPSRTERVRHPLPPGNVPPGPAVVVQTRLFFLLNDIDHGRELWVSDLSDHGTRLVKDINPGRADAVPSYQTPCPGPPLVRVRDHVFLAAEDAEHGIELWRSDGTDDGTTMVADIAPAKGTSCPSHLAEADPLLFFAAWTSDLGVELWRSDGTDEGTWAVADIRPGPEGSSPQFVTALDGIVVFTADDGVTGTELWRSDGTPDGTFLLRDIESGPAGAFAPSPHDDRRIDPELTHLNGELFFVVYDKNASEFALWRTDGTPGGTAMVRNHFAHHGPGRELTAFRDRLLFTTFDSEVGPQLWSSDGLQANTKPIRTFHPAGDSEPQSLTTVGSMLYFAADDGSGRELWTSDGTASGTTLIQEINMGAADAFLLYSGAPGILVELAGDIYFGAYGPAGRTLWRSDGTTVGTRPVGESQFERSSYISQLTAIDDVLYFFSTDSASGAQLWESDGTAVGTRRIVDLNYEGSWWSSFGLFGFQGEVFFGWNNLEAATPIGHELWKIPGPVRVKDIHPGANGSLPTNPTRVGDGILFAASDDTFGRELWRTDGTETGTMLIKDIFEGPGDGVDLSRPYGAVTFHDLLIFAANHGGGPTLWRSDGTAEGTFEIANVEPTALSVVGDLVFFAGRDRLHGSELWRTDGTIPGTFLIADINPGSSSSRIGTVMNVGGAALFFANDGTHGEELWRSDGTREGTVLVADIMRGASSSADPYDSYISPKVIDGVALFAADDGEHGLELWRSDGTRNGTFLLHEFAPGAASSSPAEFIAANDHVFLIANDNRHGRELWALGRDDIARQPLNQSGGSNGCQLSGSTNGAWDVCLAAGVVLYATRSYRRRRRFRSRLSPIRERFPRHPCSRC